MLCGRIYSLVTNPMLAGLEIIVLWLMIYETYLSFLKLIKSGYLFIPYLAWVSFAMVLKCKYLVVE
jgi:tryptophan-rich sensory protein